MWPQYEVDSIKGDLTGVCTFSELNRESQRLGIHQLRDLHFVETPRMQQAQLRKSRLGEDVEPGFPGLLTKCGPAEYCCIDYQLPYRRESPFGSRYSGVDERLGALERIAGAAGSTEKLRVVVASFFAIAGAFATAGALAVTGAGVVAFAPQPP